MTFLLIMLYKFKCYCVSFDKSDVTHIISSQSHFCQSFLFTVLLGINFMRLASKRAKLPKSQEDKTKPYLSEGDLVLNISISGSYLVIPQQQNSLFLPNMSHAQLFADTFQYSLLPQTWRTLFLLAPTPITSSCYYTFLILGVSRLHHSSLFHVSILFFFSLATTLSTALSLYVQSPGREWEYRGAVSNETPSGVFALMWPEELAATPMSGT